MPLFGLREQHIKTFILFIELMLKEKTLRDQVILIRILVFRDPGKDIISEVEKQFFRFRYMVLN